MKKILLQLILAVFCFYSCTPDKVYMSGNEHNDLYRLLLSQDVPIALYPTAAEAVEAAPQGSAVLLTATDYPAQGLSIDKATADKAADKGLRIFAEFIKSWPGVDIDTTVTKGTVERAVVMTDFFGPELKPMDLLSANDTHFFKAKSDSMLLGYGRLAGFDTAIYGTDSTDIHPLLIKGPRGELIALSALSNFTTARYAPSDNWQALWTGIMRRLTGNNDFVFKSWTSDPHPTYDRNSSLPADARRMAVSRSAQWLEKGRFIINPQWMDTVLKYQGDGLVPLGPPVPRDFSVGDGSMGLLEGHASNIYADGSEQYRFWLRADVQGEGAFLLASAAKLLDNEKYADIARNVLKYAYESSDFRKNSYRDPKSPTYGLIGWSMTHPWVFYNDDNARLLLGTIGAQSLLGTEKWNKDIVECIFANFRLANAGGFLPDRFEEPDLLAKGRDFYAKSDLVLPHPHFESWMWACYLWLYDKTGYKPLLDKAKAGISTTMESYPDGWHWTNGIQQERARMILPLAWLVRVEDTPKHRQWLNTIVDKLLENQDKSGAIREELGDPSKGMFGFSRSNADYGVNEAPLIAQNGDPVADMLYTNNFAFFALNEAAHATGDERIRNAADLLSDFLLRIQASSENHPDMDGAWMRAFDFERWDYYASNADHGWGAWSTLTGWIQAWITATQALMENNTSFWELTGDSTIKNEADRAMWMLQ